MPVYKYEGDKWVEGLNSNGEKEIKNAFSYTINRDPSNDKKILKVEEGSVFIVANPRFKSHEKFGRFESYANKHDYGWDKVSTKEGTIVYSRLWLNTNDDMKAAKLFMEYYKKDIRVQREKELKDEERIEALRCLLNTKEVE